MSGARGDLEKNAEWVKLTVTDYGRMGKANWYWLRALGGT